MKKNIKKYLIQEDSSLKKALMLINVSAHKCLCVVDKKNKFLGTISDGDIRKFLLKNLSLNVSINKIYNKKSKFAKLGEYNLNDIKKTFTKSLIDILPVLNDKKNVVSVFTWLDFIDQNSNILNNYNVFIMAGGLGTRLLPITNSIPKPLLEIDQEPMIKRIIDKFLNQGVKKFYISINYKKKLISNFIDRIYKNSYCKIEYIEEKKPLGTIGSLRHIYDKTSEDNIIVINCDTLISYDLKSVLEFHTQKKSDITVISSKTNLNIPYGQLIINRFNKISKIIEKPKFEVNLNVGCYIISKKIIELIPKNKKFDATDLIKKAISLKYDIFSYNISRYDWIEIGKIHDLNNFEGIINGK